MNRISDASGNPTISAERVLPWIQDTEEDNVWSQWDVTYRDVLIVDGAGELVGVYNLTTNDLSNQDNFLALASMISTAARLVDDDNDKLSDWWELEMFGDLTTASSSDPNHLISYAFGATVTPREPRIGIQVIREADGLSAQIQFDARSGTAGGLAYQLEMSEDGINWQPFEVILDATAPPRPHYNGSAMQTFTYKSATPLTQRAGLIRARADFPSQ